MVIYSRSSNGYDSVGNGGSCVEGSNGLVTALVAMITLVVAMIEPHLGVVGEWLHTLHQLRAVARLDAVAHVSPGPARLVILPDTKRNLVQSVNSPSKRVAAVDGRMVNNELRLIIYVIQSCCNVTLYDVYQLIQSRRKVAHSKLTQRRTLTII